MLLKQLHIARLLLAVLLFSQTGLAVNVIYCGENINRITLKNAWKNSEAADSCSHSNEELEEISCCEFTGEEEKCCFVEIISQSSEDYINVLGLSFDFFISNDAYFYQSNLYLTPIETEKISKKNGFTPNAPPLYKLYHQFIFYA